VSDAVRASERAPHARPTGSEGTGAPWSSDARKTWALHTLAEHARAEITARFELAGIPTLAVKGIVTAETLYRDVVHRPMTDVDLRIRRKDFSRALSIARQNGWPVVRVLRAYRNIVLTKGGVSIDIETHVGPPGLCAMTVEQMLDRAHVLNQEPGRTFRTPELHDHVIVLCVNAYKDKLRGAYPWAIEDLVRIVRDPSLSIQRLVELATQSKVRTLVWLVADWLAEVRGDECWRRVRSAVGDPPPRPLYAAIMRRMLRGRPDSLANRLLARAAADTVGHRLLALATACAVEVELGVYGRWPGIAARSSGA